MPPPHASSAWRERWSGCRIRAASVARQSLLKAQRAGEASLKVQYPDPAGRDGDARHGLPAQCADPGGALLRAEIARRRESILWYYVVQHLDGRIAAYEQHLMGEAVVVDAERNSRVRGERLELRCLLRRAQDELITV